jgi:uncharacterized membrane protein
MRSWHDRARLGLVLVLFGACGSEWTPPQGSDVGDGEQLVHVDAAACETTYLDYDNFGAPFVLDWCRGCHSNSIPGGMRQDAPQEVNFDTPDDVRTWGPRIAARAASRSPSMPPAGGPSSEERRLLAEWVTCGMR